ncbi:hypothetical protein IT6_02240 [Methylacidiphilum caldifontis]|uniref:hypothetical protein n=1 Tax=Methylacidiphilum caldifontis TaxID=2795386 RepID=UPI001A8F93A5|nr:hypothetical protein [Methylacidiphilum caldifontis]QSR89128.1 hypothetical protein IT6_02240 [Methylacidiphilum caldifontis]
MQHVKESIEKELHKKPPDSIRGFQPVALIRESDMHIVHLEVLLLVPEEPGTMLSQVGDLDNRLKTLLDALRIPKEQEIPENDYPQEVEKPYFYCLLEDDALITSLSVFADRDLREQTDKDKSHTLAIIRIHLEKSITTLRTMTWTC